MYQYINIFKIIYIYRDFYLLYIYSIFFFCGGGGGYNLLTCKQLSHFPGHPWVQNPMSFWWTALKRDDDEDDTFRSTGWFQLMNTLYQGDMRLESKVVSTHRTGTHPEQPLPTGYNGIPFIVGQGIAWGVLYVCCNFLGCRFVKIDFHHFCLWDPEWCRGYPNKPNSNKLEESFHGLSHFWEFI